MVSFSSANINLSSVCWGLLALPVCEAESGGQGGRERTWCARPGGADILAASTESCPASQG